MATSRAAASSSRATDWMDVDDIEPGVASDGDGYSDDEREISGNDSSGLDDSGSDEDYVEDNDGRPSQATTGPVAVAGGDARGDLLFQRLAHFISKKTAGEEGEGVLPEGSAFQQPEFHQELARIDEEELPQAARRVRRRMHKAHRTTHEASQLLGRANMAYIMQDYSQAIELLREVIRHDPYVQAAWTTLGTIYKELGQVEVARQMRFFSAHIDEDVGTWRELAEEFRQEAENSPDPELKGELLHQTLYCLRKALKIDPSSLEILWQLVSIYRTTGAKKKSVEVFKKIHRIEPSFLRDFNMLMEIHPMINELHQYSFGATAFGDAFLFNFTTFDSPEDSKPGLEENTMKLEHIVVYVDYLLNSGDAEGAVSVIHRGQRWMQGRKTEKGWDAVDDDSEYYRSREDGEDEDGANGGNDLDTQLRYRLALARLRMGQDDEAMVHVNIILGLDAIIHGTMFQELGDALMKRQMWEAALECWAALHDRSEDEDDPQVIYKLGVCQHNLKRNSEALDSLQWVVSADEENTEARLVLAQVLEDMGRKAEALEIVSDVVRFREGRERMMDGRTKGERTSAQRLNKRVLEAQAQQSMHKLWTEVQDAEDGINNGDPWALDRFIQAAGTMVETFRLHRGNFTKNRGITRVPKRRKYGSKTDITSQAMAMQDRLERTLGFEDDTPLDSKMDYMIQRQTEFYAIDVEAWLSLTIKYCCVLMVKNEEDVAMDILEHVLWSGLFNSRRCEIALRLTTIACAMRMKAFDKVVDNCKRLSQMHQFRAEPLLVMQACLGGGLKQLPAWQNLALQKYLHRELRIFDEAVTGIKLRFNPRHRRWAQIQTVGQSRRLGDLVDEELEETGSRRQSLAPRAAADADNEEDEADDIDEGENDDDNEDEDNGREEPDNENVNGDSDEAIAAQLECPKPTQFSPIFNTLYGQNMLMAKSFQSALFYFLRAHEACPYDAFLCFLIAQAYFGRALVRQSDNRNYQISQGLSFLTKYRKLSPQDVISQEEVEYNHGRAFHGLGIHHVAVKHYGAMLASVRARLAAAEDDEERQWVRESSLSREAAHNLCLIYAASGCMEEVRIISDEWLALVE